MSHESDIRRKRSAAMNSKVKLTEEFRYTFVCAQTAATLLGVPDKTLQYRRRDGLLPHWYSHAGNVKRYMIGDLIDYLKSIRYPRERDGN